jgi:CRP-like cAMP-binding protein
VRVSSRSAQESVGPGGGRPTVGLRIPGFRILPAVDRAKIDAAARLEHVERGECLFEAGSPSTWVWAVVEGLVHMVRVGPGDKQSVLEVIPPGDLFGAIVALDERPYPLAAVAVEPSIVWRVPSALVREIARHHPTLRAAILQHVAPRLRAAHERLHSIACEPVEQRLARALLVLAVRVGEPGTAPGRPLTVTRQELADMIGTTVETVIRITGRWRAGRVVSTGRGQITVLDPARLRAIADGGEIGAT